MAPRAARRPPAPSPARRKANSLRTMLQKRDKYSRNYIRVQKRPAMGRNCRIPGGPPARPAHPIAQCPSFARHARLDAGRPRQALGAGARSGEDADSRVAAHSTSFVADSSGDSDSVSSVSSAASGSS